MSTLRLFHASEEAGICLFDPRPVPSPDSGVLGAAVWAVDEAKRSASDVRHSILKANAEFNHLRARRDAAP